MLKKFFSNLLSSFMGAWLALVMFGAVVVIVIIGLIAKSGISSSSASSVSKGSILKLELSGQIVEYDQSNDFDYVQIVSGNTERPQSLRAIVSALEEGASNDNIKGLYINCNGVVASPATMHALREAVIKFKKNKPVYAYGDSYSMSDYYIASVADSLFVNPAGSIEIRGVSGGIPYMKGLFDMIGIEFQVVKVGTYKSAVEPYIMSEMSQPARAQLDTLYGNMWSYIRSDLSKSRKNLTPVKIQTLANDDLIQYAPLSEAKKANLYDKAIYRREMKKVLARLAGKKEEKLNIVSTSEIVSQSSMFENMSSKHQIAVLYAVGDIVDNGNVGISAEEYVPLIVELADNENVKGLVLRVNSPGGSAFASEQIGEALDYFRSKGKPLAVSMGDYAASGGYWISAGADRIFADPLTITGSIGIFGLIPNVKHLTDKFGVNMQWVSTTPNAIFPNLFEPMTERQTASMQAYVERGYDTFIKRVATGRKMSESKVRSIAEGRVWDATSAKRIGLVDELGSLENSIEWVAKKADILAKYNVCVYPKLEPSIWDFLPQAGMDMTVKKLSEKIGPTYDEKTLRRALKVIQRKPVQSIMPEMDVLL